MPPHMASSRRSMCPAPAAHAYRCSVALLVAAAALLLPAPLVAVQQTAPAQGSPPSTAIPAPSGAAVAAPPSPPAPPAQASQSAPSASSADAPAITEDQLRQLLVGKDLYLRSGYLDNNLQFNENGALIGHSPQGSYTLSGIRITKIRVQKHKVDLEGERYGLHFLGALPGEAPAAVMDRVNITPRSRPVRITIDREIVFKEKQPKPKPQKSRKGAAPPASKAITPSAQPAQAASHPATAPATSPAPAATAEPNSSAVTLPPNAASSDASAANTPENSETPLEAYEAKEEIDAAPPYDRPEEAKSVTGTHSQAHANQLLRSAIDKIFAQGLDERLMAVLPDYWKVYYQSAGETSESWPQDPTVFRQSTVDKKARLISAIDPASNQYAQEYGVAGLAEYRVVVGADGKPKQIAILRPIGFGLDESAVDALNKAAFEPAQKDGHPVPVALDMVVEFRIYSHRTAQSSNPRAAQMSNQPILPGPYSVQH